MATAKITVEQEAAKVAALSTATEALYKAKPAPVTAALVKDVRAFVAMQKKLASVGSKAYAANPQRLQVLKSLESLEDRLTAARKAAGVSVAPPAAAAAAAPTTGQAVDVAAAQSDRLINLQRLASTLAASKPGANTRALVSAIVKVQNRLKGSAGVPGYNSAPERKTERAAIWDLVTGYESAYKTMASNGGQLTPELAKLLGVGGATASGGGGGLVLAVLALGGLAYVGTRR